MTHLNQVTRDLRRFNGAQHTTAIGPRAKPISKALVGVLENLAAYADAFEANGGTVESDFVMREEYLDAVKFVRNALNFETGGLDGGTVDHAAVTLLKKHRLYGP